MPIYRLMSRFWVDTSTKPASPSEIAVYHYLLNMANRNMWQMPVACYTTLMSVQMRLSRKSIIEARDKLQEKGYISFVKGSSASAPALYTLLEKDGVPIVQKGPEQVTTEVIDKVKVGVTPKVTGSVTHNKIKDIRHNTLLCKEEKEEESLSLVELEKKFLEDSKWQLGVIETLNGKVITTDELSTFIKRFFCIQKTNMKTYHNERECRNHFGNWMRMDINKQNNNNYYENRHSDIKVAPPEEVNYHEAF